MIEKTERKVPSIEVPRSMSDQVYQILRESILANEFKPGDRLVELQLSELLETSRTPIREAIRRLEHDGLVERLPQGGVRVKPVTMESVRQVYGLRGVLESYAVLQACDRITEEDLTALDQIRQQALELMNSKSMERAEEMRRLLALNTDFHDTLNHICEDAYLLKMLDVVHQEVIRMRGMALQNKANWEEVWEQHKELLQLIREGEKEKLDQFVKQHAARGAEYVMEALKGIATAD